MDQLLKFPHRTYLWVYLVFDYLKTTGFKKTAVGVDSAIAHLPETANDAYEQILSKSTELSSARKALCAILAAGRPLTLSEMNVIVNIDNMVKSIHDLDLEAERDFEQSLRRWCGLFVSIHHSKIYFLHQTAREFLLADLALPAAVPSGLQWHHSVTTRQAHTVLAEACVLYLNFFNSNDRLQTTANGEAGYSLDTYTFLDYSAKTWGAHFREAGTINNAAIISYALRICDPDSKSYSAWFGIYWQTIYWRTPRDFTNLMVAAHFGHEDMVRLLLGKGANVEAKDGEYSRTPLLLAAGNGHAAVVKLLLDKGANIEAKDSDYGQTPLWLAARNGHAAVVKLLLEKGANIEAKDNYSQTPLLWAAEGGHVAVVKLLLDKGADVEAKDNYSQTPLLLAVRHGQEAVVKLLLDKGAADVEAKDNYSWTPLLLAARDGHAAVVKLLLDKGAADVEAKDNYSWTPLLLAARDGHAAVVKLLLDKGADVKAKDNYSRMPLPWAAENGHAAVVKLLLDKGADVEAKDNYSQTPLLLAVRHGQEAAVELLQRKA